MDQIYSNFRKINLANALFCLLVGLGLNGTLLWLIVKHKNERELVRWRWILLQTCLTDMYLITFWFFIQPATTSDPTNGTQWVFLSSPFGNIPTLAGYILFNVYYTSLLFMVGAISMQFVNRYLIICRLHKFSWQRYALLLSILIGWLLFLALIRLPGGSYPDEGYQQLPDSIAFYLSGRRGNAKVNSALYTNPSPLPNVLFWQSVLERSLYATNFVYLGINLFCAWRIRKFVKSTMQDANQSQQADINRQLTFNLILQGIIPLVRLLLITLSAYVAMDLTNNDEILGQTIGLYAMMPNSWIPLINPAITLLVIRPYRQFLMAKLLCCCCPNGNGVTQIQRLDGTTMANSASNAVPIPINSMGAIRIHP